MASSDHNLLFGVLAWQNGLIAESQLLSGLKAWSFEKTTPLGQHLVREGAISPSLCERLNRMVTDHIALFEGDPAQSLHALSSVSAVSARIRDAVSDDELHVSLTHLPGDAAPLTQTFIVDHARKEMERFQILREYARGGLGRVSIALDSQLNREVVVKEIRSERCHDPESQSRFLREAEITGGLEHPGVVPVYALGQHPDGSPYYAMRFVRGDSLKRAVQRYHRPDQEHTRSHRNLAFRELLQRFTDVCHAMEYAHSRGVLHRDLKPDNIMLGKYGETLVVDWGLARTATDAPSDVSLSSEPRLKPRSGSDSAPTQMGEVLGTPAYMSPEQAAGRLDAMGPPTDVYSLGATLYEILTGQAPFRKNNDVTTILQRVEKGDFPAPRTISPDVARSLEAICLKAMSRTQADRYDSPDSLARDVDRWLADEGVMAYPESFVARSRRWIRKHQTVMASVIVAILVLTATVAGFASTLSNKNNDLNVANATLDRKNHELTAQKAELTTQKTELTVQKAKLTAQTVELTDANDQLTFLARQRQLNTSEAAMLAGEYALVLSQTDDVDPTGIADEIDFRRALLRVEALVGLNRAVEVQALITSLPQGPTPELRARRLLLQGDALLFEPMVPVKDLFTEALELGLNEIDTEYAQALLAEDLETSIEHLGNLTEQQPQHLRAQSLLAMSLFITGRLQETRDVCEFGLRLWPNQVEFLLVLFLVESSETRLEAAQQLLDLLRPQMQEQEIAALEFVGTIFSSARQQLNGIGPPPIATAFQILEVLMRQQVVSADNPLALRVPPQLARMLSVAAPIPVLVDYIQGKDMTNVLRNLTSVSDDGVFHLWLARAEADPRLREEALLAAVDKYSFVPGVRQRALHELVLAAQASTPPGDSMAQQYVDAAAQLAIVPSITASQASDVARVLRTTDQWRLCESMLQQCPMDDAARDDNKLLLYWDAQQWGRFLDFCENTDRSQQAPWPERRQTALQHLQSQVAENTK
jgi:serine/threonine protein kinase